MTVLVGIAVSKEGGCYAHSSNYAPLPVWKSYTNIHSFIHSFILFHWTPQIQEDGLVVECREGWGKGGMKQGRAYMLSRYKNWDAMWMDRRTTWMYRQRAAKPVWKDETFTVTTSSLLLLLPASRRLFILNFSLLVFLHHIQYKRLSCRWGTACQRHTTPNDTIW